jgi:N-acetyl sugar amidotransferase
MHKTCNKCNYNTEHPFGLTLNNGLCSGCMTHEEKNYLNWDARSNLLAEELEKIKKNKRTYDCVVPVVGDAEDFYTLSRVLELGLSPLVVGVNDYFKNDIGWHNIHQLITHFDVDSFIFNPDIRVYKDLVRTSLRKYNHILLPFLQLHTSFPVHVAVERKIPLIIWGQNQAIEQVGKFSHSDDVQMSRWNRRQHDLFEVEIDDLIGNGAQLDTRYINYYKYPSLTDINKKGVKGLYLSNYYRWDPLAQNHSVRSFGFKPETNLSSFDIYERAGSSVYYKFHDLLKLQRTGYRKIRDHTVREIRHGRLDKINALAIEKNYSERPIYIKPFFDWIGATKSGYEWYKMHRLNDVQHLIAEEEIQTETIPIPTSLQKLITKSQASKEDYLLFNKGIDIII